MSSAKKRKIYLIMVFAGIALFFVSMISFIILAVSTEGNVTSSDVSLAWFLFALIILGTLLSFIGVILYILLNKEKIKDYLNKITK